MLFYKFFFRTVLSWNVANVDDINEDSLSLLPLIEPKLDIIVIGTGDPLKDRSFHTRLMPFAIKNKLNLEILPTCQACTTFNFLNSEGRYVAAAMIPPDIIHATEDDVLRTKLRYENLYKIE